MIPKPWVWSEACSRQDGCGWRKSDGRKEGQQAWGPLRECRRAHEVMGKDGGHREEKSDFPSTGVSETKSLAWLLSRTGQLGEGQAKRRSTYLGEVAHKPPGYIHCWPLCRESDGCACMGSHHILVYSINPYAYFGANSTHYSLFIIIIILIWRLFISTLIMLLVMDMVLFFLKIIIIGLIF